MSCKKKKSIKLNVIVNVVRILLNAIFPLITFPYIARVISVEDIGRYDFGNSIISYFSLIASFVINAYAIREGGKIRDEKQKINVFASQLFSINLLAMLTSVFSLYIICLLIPNIISYRIIILIQSISIITLPFSIDWVFSVYEDYIYITVRSLLIQLLTLVLLFIFVKSENDFYFYVLISTLSLSLPHIINYLVARKYVCVRFTIHNNWKKHRSPILIFFVNNIATTIYLNSDVTLLGIMCNDTIVGIYSVATKIYMVVKKIINAATAVVIPRLVYYLNIDEVKYFDLLNKILNWTILLSVPMSFCIAEFNTELVFIIGGGKYEKAANTVSILAMAVVFAILANIIVNGILVIQKRKNFMVITTFISAMSNIILNFFLIPKYEQNGAAITTVIAELIVLIMSLYFIRDLIYRINILKTIIQAIICIVFAYTITIYIKNFFSNLSIFVYISILMGLNFIIYFMGLILLKNEYVLELVKRYKNSMDYREKY